MRHQPLMRPATAEDFEAVYGYKPARTIRAMTAELDGKPVGVAGLAFGGERPLFFSNILPELRPFKRFILRAARQLAVMAREAHAAAVADPREPRSHKLLEHLGFEQFMTSDEGAVFQWKC